ncbi:MAG: hypothetical protein RL033_109 [Pseudomonadota bacterium]
MKKLLDDNTDDLTRALLEAGRSHRPPAANRGKLLLALGVSSGVALLSSKAFAWLGTSTGKLTVLGVGVAGMLYGALPSSEGVERSEARLSPATSDAVPALASARPVAAPSASLVAAPSASLAAAPSALAPTVVPAHVADAPSPLGRDPVAGLPAVNEGSARREDAPAASESPHRTAKARKGSGARRDDVRDRREASRAGALPEASPPPVGSTVEASEAYAPGLESEIQLVDAMRGAAQRNDAHALRGLVASYRDSFPAGQLRAEVAELALRALPSSH